jgi:hypothetical protein
VLTHFVPYLLRLVEEHGVDAFIFGADTKNDLERRGFELIGVLKKRLPRHRIGLAVLSYGTRARTLAGCVGLPYLF